MKLLIPIGAFFPNQTDGPSFSLYWLSKGLINTNIDVTIYTTDLGVRNIETNTILKKKFGEIIYFKTFFHKLPIKLIIKSLCNFYKFDTIIITSLFYPLSIIILLFSFLFKKKIIISTRGELFQNSLKR